ncbi:DNA primase [Leptolyngbya phage Lbo240-yong1]|uniref:DNA primase n=1 Tax=Leptolyngbya phage Lbo240-yong1 TaxID=2928836 RepID=A0A9X9E770_9CAUD|nr:DNA primase [Leptolyngbya phage Lbo240-yong1]
MMPQPGLSTRGVTAETCEMYRVYSTGVPLEIVAEFLDDNLEPVAYHYRKGGWIPEQGKKSTWWAEGSVRTLFGYHLWVEQGFPTNIDVALCEGETDAMALSQAMPDVLCLALAGNPSSELWGEWLTTISSMTGENGKLYLAFDADADGDKYTEYVDDHYTKTRCQLDLQGFKDVAEMLLEGCDPKWVSLPKLPASIVSAVEVNAKLRTKGVAYEPGLSLGWTRVDHLTSGYYPGSLLMVAAPAKAGKSSFVGNCVVNFITLHKQPVMFVPLEMPIEQVQPLLGACILGEDLESADPNDVFDAVDSISPLLHWVRHYGRIMPEDIDKWFKAAKMLGVKLVVIDPIQAATAQGSLDHESATVNIDALMYHISGQLIRYEMSGLVVSHVNTAEPDQRVSPDALRGSRGLAQIPTCVLGLQRVDDGATKLYTLIVDRRLGRSGEVHLEYHGHRFKETMTKKEAML